MILKRILKRARLLHPFLDILFSPFVLIDGVWLRVAKFIGLKKLPITKSILFKLGIFPIVEHYYEPRFNFSFFNYSKEPRNLPGINYNQKEQVQLISSLDFQEELKAFSEEKVLGLEYYYNNGSFPSGDSELYYSLIRKFKPSKIVEVGSGFSTRIAVSAKNKNAIEGDEVDITCIEPYEMPWLENLDITVIRKKVENVEIDFFKNLDENDILFIDSSHVIRPGSDVLHEILHILPILNIGVIIHFHDIFTPYEYPETWLTEEFRLWNEQYMLEAFLSFNDSFKIIASMSYLNGERRELLNQHFPIFAAQSKREPGSIWIRKVK